jgi:hypothetical protein
MAMRNLGELHGDGHIVLKDGSRSATRYVLRVVEDGSRMKSADGTLAGEEGVLYAAFEQGRCTLELSDGARVRVIVTRLGCEGAAEIVVSGPVPESG